METHVEIAPRAKRDLKGVPVTVRRRISAALRDLSDDPPPANFDIKALKGATPWLRMRVGSYRIVFCPLEPDEIVALGTASKKGILVARIVDRRDFDQAVRGL